MPSRVLIVHDSLLAPPSSITSFRDLTHYCTVFLRIDCLVCSDERTELWKTLRTRGCHDFVRQLISTKERQDGVWLDLEYDHPRTIVTDQISPERLNQLRSEVRARMPLARQSFDRGDWWKYTLD